MDTQTLNGKLMFGYQGWFSTPQDGSALKDWTHWTKDHHIPSQKNMAIDLWPDLTEFMPQELEKTNLKYSNGNIATVFSSFRFSTVRRHFQWMQDYGIQGIFLQRFVSEITPHTPTFQFRNQVLQNVLKSAAETGRVVSLMYDVTGSNPATVVEDIQKDWIFLVDQQHLLNSTQYLHHKGKPLLALWGFGFSNRKFTPEKTLQLIHWFTHSAPKKYQVTLMGGVPTHWRTLTKDADSNPLWSHVYRSYDVLSPWMVGRFKSQKKLELLIQEVTQPDLMETRKLGIDYMPVIFPGFSWANLKNEASNTIPRNGGLFYWNQIISYLKTGNKMLYGAMFDEIDEGTAIFKVAPTPALTPVFPHFLSLAEEGYSIPNDWYLRLSGIATQMLSGQRPVSEKLPEELCAKVEANNPICKK